MLFEEVAVTENNSVEKAELIDTVSGVELHVDPSQCMSVPIFAG